MNMPRILALLAALLISAPAGTGLAQTIDEPVASAPAETPPPPPPAVLPPPPAGVEVSTLAAPDAFTTEGRDTGLPADLWRGASARTARMVLPLLARKPLSPAAAQLARRVLAAGAQGPEGTGQDPALAGLRAGALLAQGDPQAAGIILARASGADRYPELARAAAEAALLTGDDARACAVEQGLGTGRDDIYWIRLRAYCQAIAGQVAQAQFTFDLAQAQSRDAVYGRLMGAKLSGAGSPGAASLRDGLDYALSRSLGLDLAAAKPSPAISAALSGGAPAPLSWDLAGIDADTGGMASAALSDQMLPPGALSVLIGAAAEADPKTTGPKLQAAALLIAALSRDLSADDRARIAAFGVPEGRTPAGRAFALGDAGRRGQMGSAALLSLWIAAEAGAEGVGVADRARIIHALMLTGLSADARAFAGEGLAGLK